MTSRTATDGRTAPDSTHGTRGGRVRVTGSSVLAAAMAGGLLTVAAPSAGAVPTAATVRAGAPVQVTLSRSTVSVGESVVVSGRAHRGALVCRVTVSAGGLSTGVTARVRQRTARATLSTVGYAPGTYQVSLTCGRGSASRTLTVLDPHATPAPTPTPTTPVPAPTTPAPAPTRPAPTATASPTQSGIPVYEVDHIKKVASWIVEDIVEVDDRLLDGIMVSSRLSMLADNYGRLLESPVPPGVDPVSYQAQLSTLQKFADMAAEEYYDYPMQATARYEVVRQQTQPVLDAVNTAFGTSCRVPNP